MRFKKSVILILLGVGLIRCSSKTKGGQDSSGQHPQDQVIKPIFTTEAAAYDTDDPAIWINAKEPTNSLILGTDKGGDAGDGSIYVYDLKGRVVKRIQNIKRPDNIDVEYGFLLGDSTIDIAVFTERYAKSIRVYKLPEMQPIDNGGIPVFAGETDTKRSAPMGIAVYKRPRTGEVFAIVSRKAGPDGSYLWEYQLRVTDSVVEGQLVRKFGHFSGTKEIEAVAVDDALGKVYYSDERFGVRAYYADPDSTNEELALFGQKDFTGDMEGISIYPTGDSTGYILVSDQQANAFQIYRREMEGGVNHQHIGTLYLSTVESDGSDVTPFTFNGMYPGGLFVAMSNNATFQLYSWSEFSITP